MPGFDVVGDGGLFTTAEDLAKWNPTALDGALTSSGLSALMVTPGRLVSGDTLIYAMGLYFDTYRGLPIVRHGGRYDGYRAGDRLAAVTPPPAAAPPPVPSRPAESVLLKEVGDLPGTYFSEELDIRWTVQGGASDGIALQRRNLPPVALTSLDSTKTRFTVVGSPVEVRFERAASGRGTGFILDSGDFTGIRFVKLK